MPRPKKKYMLPLVPPTIPAPVVVPQFFTVPQVAAYLSSTIASTRTWLKAQKIPRVKIGRRFIYKRSDIDQAWLRAAR